MASGPTKPPLALEQACRIWRYLPDGISYADTVSMQELNEHSCLIIEQVSFLFYAFQFICTVRIPV